MKRGQEETRNSELALQLPGMQSSNWQLQQSILCKRINF